MRNKLIKFLSVIPGFVLLALISFFLMSSAAAAPFCAGTIPAVLAAMYLSHVGFSGACNLIKGV